MGSALSFIRATITTFRVLQSLLVCPTFIIGLILKGFHVLRYFTAKIETLKVCKQIMY